MIREYDRSYGNDESDESFSISDAEIYKMPISRRTQRGVNQDAQAKLPYAIFFSSTIGRCL
jgi:hypothetical protein